MSKLSENIVRELLDDDIFVNKCKSELNEIMKDKKFDSGDLPEVMSLIVLVTEKYDTFDIDKNDIVEVFRLLIVELLKRLNLIEESNSEIDKMLESCLKLLVLKVKTKSLWQKICKCCKPKKEIKIQQLEETKQDINNKIVKELQDIGEIEIKVNNVSEVNDLSEDISELNEEDSLIISVEESEVNEESILSVEESAVNEENKETIVNEEKLENQ